MKTTSHLLKSVTAAVERLSYSYPSITSGRAEYLNDEWVVRRGGHDACSLRKIRRQMRETFSVSGRM